MYVPYNILVRVQELEQVIRVLKLVGLPPPHSNCQKMPKRIAAD